MFVYENACAIPNIFQCSARVARLLFCLLTILGWGVGFAVETTTGSRVDIDKEKLGQDPDGNKPSDNAYFLRQATLVLDQKELNLDVGLAYSRQQFGSLVARILTILFQIQYGLSQRTEISIGVPTKWISISSENSNGEKTISEKESGVTEWDVSVKYIVSVETTDFPEVVLTASYQNQRVEFTDNDKFDTFSSGVNFVSISNPLVSFYGIRLEYAFPENYLGDRYERDLAFNYFFGYGMAVNSNISFSQIFQGGYERQRKKNDKSNSDRSIEPMSMTFSLTKRLKNNNTIEPAINVGLNEDSPDTVILFTYSKKLH